jgi:hypothetical protein
MAPTVVREPFHRDRWVYEEEVDSRRMLAYKDGERPHGHRGEHVLSARLRFGETV